jgi:SAM-dependent MidA family methyltransferase
MPEARARTPLASLLAERIRASGPITFAEYMEACLYHPEHGYYSGAGVRHLKDYYTSVDVHPVFGRLLARQFHEMWSALGNPERFWLVEAGAGTGRLAKHILDFAQNSLAEFYAQLSYVAVETSSARRDQQAITLARHISAGRAVSSAELPAEIPSGCIFSNELFDALPVHRVVRDAGELREIWVDFRDERFVEKLGPLATPAIADYFARQGIELAEDQQAEAGLEACRWMEDAARRLGRGFVLTVDYGHEARELYNERHMRGTLLAYERHRASEDFYRAPGEHDLTAHVNFTALEMWGARAGLETAGLTSQGHFLLAWAAQNEFADLYDDATSGVANEKNEVERLRARLLFKNLIHPEGMGETFRVLIQHKGVSSPHLTGLVRLW